MILVAAGTGDLGDRVVRLLSGQGHHVRCLYRLRPKNPPWVSLVPPWFAAT
jgi:uncharacterized protein YbjT (DUF2867 family)